MRKLLAALIVAMAVLGGLVAQALVASTASAYTGSELQYISSVESFGISPNLPRMVIFGYQICSDLHAGYSPWLLVGNAQASGSGGGYTEMQGRGIVASASRYLCPDMFYLIVSANI